MCHIHLASTWPEVPPTPRGPSQSLWKTLSQAAGSVVGQVVALSVRGDPGVEALQAYREAQGDAEDRAQRFYLGTMAKVEAGTLAPNPDSKAAETPLPDAPDDGHWACPRTQRALEPLTVQGLHMHVNPACGGLMIERSSEQSLVAHPELWPEFIAVADRLAQEATEVIDGRALVYLSCPTCGGSMVRKNFEKVSGIIVDTCPRHGTWFDANELQGVLRFLEAGGRNRRAAFEAKEAAYLAEQRRSIQDIEARIRTRGPGHSAEFLLP